MKSAFNQLHTSDSNMRTLANSEDPDDNAAFHQGLQFAKTKTISIESITIFICKL